MLILFLLIIAIASALLIAWLLMVHWREIRLLDPNSIAEERERQKRDELLMHRLTRIHTGKMAPVKAIAQKVIHAGKTTFHAGYLKLVRLEKFYQHAKAPFASVAPSVKDRVKVLLDDARSLARDMKWADAERRYLEVLTIDARSFEAYKGLGGIYLKQKLPVQAKETFEFIVKSKKADDVVCAGLAEIAEQEGDLKRAEEMLLKAIEFRPRLAHRHAELASFYLSHDQARKAWPYTQKSVELEPKSVKYLELSLDAAIILGDRIEAQRCYDKLRVASEDRQKVQVYKDKIDALSA